MNNMHYAWYHKYNSSGYLIQKSRNSKSQMHLLEYIAFEIIFIFLFSQYCKEVSLKGSMEGTLIWIVTEVVYLHRDCQYSSLIVTRLFV